MVWNYNGQAWIWLEIGLNYGYIGMVFGSGMLDYVR